MRKFVLSILLLGFIGISVHQPLVAQDKKLKKRVAVFVFEDKTDHSHHWWGQQSVGEGMADMLTTQLVKQGNYTVVERQEIARIMKEQALGASGAVTEQSAAKIGQLLGVEFAVMGSVTEFGYAESKKGASFGGYGVGMNKKSATVAVDCRFVNTSTGEIIAAEHVRKEKASTGVSLNTQSMSYNNQNDFDQSVVGKATNDAITEMVDLIGKYTQKVKWQAKVIMEKDGKIYINSGKNDGLSVGEVFTVFRKGEELVDPDTGISLGATEKKIGEIKISKNDVADGKASICEIVSGSGFEKGDVVKDGK